MKKKHFITLLALVAVIALCSFTYSNKEGREIITDAEQMRTLYYRGHSYICYRYYANSIWADRSYGLGGASIVHDPDCKCGKGGGR